MTLKDDFPGEALRRLTGQVARLPVPGKADLASHFSAVRERFILLRRLGVESMYLAHRGERVDSSLLLEVGALTTNRLIALAQALPAGRLTRRGFFELMHSEVETSRERSRRGPVRESGLAALAGAQGKIDRLERSVSLLSAEVEIEITRRSAVGCAVDIALYLEAWHRREERDA